MTEVQKRTLGIAIASLVCGCFFIIPLLGFLLSVAAIVLGIVALVKINKNQEMYQGKGLAISGIVLGGLGILILPIIALLAAIAIPNLLRAKISANDALAKSTLRTLSTASETYATANNRQYPLSIYDLMDAVPPYLNTNYCDQTMAGYTYDCNFNTEEYSFTATPVNEGTSGSQSYTIVTGGIMTEEDNRSGYSY
ncbi:MAG: DUF4190 domain-containing protein [Candidatus Omnitrophica bacterium]|nr:DUF4190 domain-containing protein [Candidatus Omnitrophota bacterium]MBU1995915.1 DUF4190 domain-containing protein [Candidatus Omnitrophota bacterium]MBU4334333.1 DUF4190 domain-containing protein [Candidatus Omnitrophota bacterium]